MWKTKFNSEALEQIYYGFNFACFFASSPRTNHKQNICAQR